MTAYFFEVAGETHSVELERRPDGSYTATIGGRAYRAEASISNSESGWLLHVDGRQLLVHSAASGNQQHVHLGGKTYTLDIAQTRSQQRGRAASGGGLTAQMPGQVAAILVGEGERVERGQALMLLEAMKMEIRVTAPHAGRVNKLFVAEGDVVGRGQRLVELAEE